MTLKLIIGNKNYSSWSFRPWIAMKVAGIAFEEEVVSLNAEDFKQRVRGISGTGKVPAVGDTVTVHYKGTLVDGTEFDSSVRRGQPATFPLRALIPAWQLAVPMMTVGDTIEIATPADLAYGPTGRGPIPGGATLLFRIELLGIEGH